MKKAAPIINRPSAISLPSRLGWQIIAVLVWTCWLNCWAPLLTLAVWEFGLYQLHLSLISANGFGHFQQMITPYLPILFLQGVVMLGWASKEHICYGRRQRRQPTPAVDVAELANFGQLPKQRLAYWQRARSITADHDDHGRLRQARLPELTRIGARYQGALASVATAHLHAHLSLVVTPAKKPPALKQNRRRIIPASVALATVWSA